MKAFTFVALSAVFVIGAIASAGAAGDLTSAVQEWKPKIEEARRAMTACKEELEVGIQGGPACLVFGVIADTLGPKLQEDAKKFPGLMESLFGRPI